MHVHVHTYKAKSLQLLCYAHSTLHEPELGHLLSCLRSALTDEYGHPRSHLDISPLCDTWKGGIDLPRYPLMLQQTGTMSIKFLVQGNGTKVGIEPQLLGRCFNHLAIYAHKHTHHTHTPHIYTHTHTHTHTHTCTCIPTCMHTLTHAHYSTLHNTLTMSNNNTRCRADRIYSQSAVLTIWHVKVEGTGGLCNYTAYMSGNMLTKTILEQAYFLWKQILKDL